jgi:hypothetical protein
VVQKKKKKEKRTDDLRSLKEKQREKSKKKHRVQMRQTVFWIGSRIRMFLGLLDMDPDTSINKQKKDEKPFFFCFVTSF